MNKTVTSRQDILKAAADILIHQGSKALSIRSVAAKEGISVGSVYTYFDSKEDLLLSAVASIWQEILAPFEKQDFKDFKEAVQMLYETILSGSQKHSGFFTVHSLAFMPNQDDQAKEKMSSVFEHITQILSDTLRRDPAIRKGVLSEYFREEDFAGQILTLVIAGLLQEQPDCSSVLILIQNALY